jgi:hypothetical protein
MRKDHPQSGPSFSKNPRAKKRKLMTPAERAAYLDRTTAKLEEAKKKATKRV